MPVDMISTVRLFRWPWKNAKIAGVAAKVSVEQRDVSQFSPEEDYGCVICNPPYGERLLDLRAAEALYRQMGRVFQPKRGWNYSIITPDENFESCFGRRADRRRKLYNGMIRCQLYMYYKKRPLSRPGAANMVPDCL